MESSLDPNKALGYLRRNQFHIESISGMVDSIPHQKHQWNGELYMCCLFESRCADTLRLLSTLGNLALSNLEKFHKTPKEFE